MIICNFINQNQTIKLNNSPGRKNLLNIHVFFNLDSFCQFCFCYTNIFIIIK